MSLLLRADIALIVVFVLGATLTGLVCRALLERNAEHETRAQAELMMDSAFVARDYTSSEVAPLQQAALNPTNLRDRATDWQADIIQRFRNKPGEHEITGERDTPMGRSLYRVGSRPAAIPRGGPPIIAAVTAF